MKNPFKYILITAIAVILFWACSKEQISPTQKTNQTPYLEKQGQTAQLIVDGQPFIIRGGELGNSTFTSMENMVSVWPRLKALNLNTVLAPVYWELIEPVEGEFDFILYDQLINEARKNDI